MESIKYGNQMMIFQEKDKYCFHDTRIDEDLFTFEDFDFVDGELKVTMNVEGQKEKLTYLESIKGRIDRNGRPDCHCEFLFEHSDYAVHNSESILNLKVKASSYLSHKCADILDKKAVQLRRNYILVYMNGYYILNTKTKKEVGPFSEIIKIDNVKGYIKAKIGKYIGEFELNGTPILFTIMDATTNEPLDTGIRHVKLDELLIEDVTDKQLIKIK